MEFVRKTGCSLVARSASGIATSTKTNSVLNESTVIVDSFLDVAFDGSINASTVSLIAFFSYPKRRVGTQSGLVTSEYLDDFPVTEIKFEFNALRISSKYIRRFQRNVFYSFLILNFLFEFEVQLLTARNPRN